MKVFTFVSLLVLALGSLSARAADSGTHTVNLTVDAPTSTPILELTAPHGILGGETNIDFDSDRSYGYDGVTFKFYKNLGVFSLMGSGFDAQHHCRLSITSDNGSLGSIYHNWWMLKRVGGLVRENMLYHISWSSTGIPGSYPYFGTSYSSLGVGDGETYSDNPYRKNPTFLPNPTTTECGGAISMTIVVGAFNDLSMPAFREPLTLTPNAGTYTDTIRFTASII